MTSIQIVMDKNIKPMRILIILLFISFSSFGQEFRSYLDNANEADKICAAYAGKSYISDKAANEALQLILSTIGASKRFVLASCENIPNAMAISLKGIRYIFYNREFMSDIISKTNYWSNMSILAHEVGHHINGHTTDAILIINDVVDMESLSESRKMELEADEFAGFVLAKLGATFTEASEAIALISSDDDDTYSTHPSKSKRIAAISKGYNNATGETTGEITSTYSKTSSSTAEEYFYSGYEKGQNKDYYGAIADYNKAIELNPDNATTYYNRGWLKDDLKDYFGAIADYTKAIELNPDNDDAYINRGVAKQNLKDYYGAIADYTKVIELNPDNDDAYYNRGIAKYDLKDYYGAIADFTKAIELNPDKTNAYNNRGWSKHTLKDHYGAIADYTKAIELNPDNDYAYYNRGIAKYDLKDYYGAIADFTKAIELNPDNADAYNNRGVAKENLGDLDGACADWKKAANLGHTYAKNALVTNDCN